VLIFLTKTGIDVKYSTGTIQWFENELPLRDPWSLKDKEYVAMAEISAVQQEMEFFGMDWYDPTCYATEILDAKYEKVHIDDVVDQLNHLDDCMCKCKSTTYLLRRQRSFSEWNSQKGLPQPP
jgi:hypothetical protein